MNTLKVKCVLLQAVLPCLQNPILINGENFLLVCCLYVKLVGIGKRTHNNNEDRIVFKSY